MQRCWQHEPASRPVFDEILDLLELLAEEEDIGRLNLGVARRSSSSALLMSQ
jgi:hypothetical protein